MSKMPNCCRKMGTPVFVLSYLTEVAQLDRCDPRLAGCFHIRLPRKQPLLRRFAVIVAGFLIFIVQLLSLSGCNTITKCGDVFSSNSSSAGFDWRPRPPNEEEFYLGEDKVVFLVDDAAAYQVFEAAIDTLKGRDLTICRERGVINRYEDYLQPCYLPCGGITSLDKGTVSGEKTFVSPNTASNEVSNFVFYQVMVFVREVDGGTLFTVLTRKNSRAIDNAVVPNDAERVSQHEMEAVLHAKYHKNLSAEIIRRAKQ